MLSPSTWIAVSQAPRSGLVAGADGVALHPNQRRVLSLARLPQATPRCRPEPAGTRGGAPTASPDGSGLTRPSGYHKEGRRSHATAPL